MSEPRIGEVVGGYRLTRQLATGGMGVVFEARHASLDREAVVKVLAPKLAADEDFVSRFKHEARIASDLDHPCIVDVFDLVDVDHPRRVACVMERLEGPTLAKLLLKGPLRYEQALNVTLQIVDAIGCVHEAGVIHRDLKPQNIVVVGPLHTDLIAIPSVKILDFGIAKITETPTDHKTRTGAMLGTPAYMAPEQVAGTKVLPSTDLYAIAELLFEMLTGRRVFRGDNLDILRRKMATHPPKIEIAGSIPGHERLAALISASLHPDVDRRPAFGDFEDAVADLLEENSVGQADAATVLDLGSQTDELTSGDLPDVDDTEAPRVGDPGMNTQMFFERIVEDIEDVDTEKNADAPEPPMAPKEEDHLTLMRSPSGWNPTPDPAPRAHSVTPRTHSVAPRGGSVAPRGASVPRVVVGQPLPPPKPKRSLRGVFTALVVLVLLAAVGGAGAWAWSEGLLEPKDTTNPLLGDVRAWSATHGGYHGAIQPLVEQLREAFALDTDAGYTKALDTAKQLLVADPGHPTGLALYVETRALFDPEHITHAEHKKLSRALDLVRDGLESRRARAALLTAVGRNEEAIELLDRATSPLEQQRLAEALVEVDPSRALATIDGSDAVRELPRSATIRGLALTALGRTHAAAEALVWRAEVSVTAELALAQAQAAADRPEATKTFEAALKRTAGEGMAKAAFGAHLARRGESRAHDLLEAVAADDTLQESLRAEALRIRARRSIDDGAEGEADALLDRLDALVVNDTTGALLRAERLLAEGTPTKAAQLVANRSDAHVVAATAALSLGDEAGAKKALEAAIDGAPRDPRMRVLLGVVHLVLEDAAAVKAVIDVLAELDPAAVREDERFKRIPAATWAEAEKQLLVAKSNSPEAEALRAVVRYFAGDADAEKSLRAVKDAPLAVQMYLADLALVRGATNTANGRVAAMRRTAKKAIATNLYAARVALARRRYAEAAGIYDRILAVARSPLIEIERAEALLRTDRERAKSALAGLTKEVPHFARLRRVMYAAEL